MGHILSTSAHPTSSAICRNLAKSMTRGYAEAPHKIMAGRKTKAVFPQNDEPIRVMNSEMLKLEANMKTQGMSEIQRSI